MKYCIVFLLMSFANCFQAGGHDNIIVSEDFVKTEGITLPIHQANIGKIAFTDRSYPPQELKETDFMQSYVLTNKSDLFITVFLGNSLTNYLHVLSPDSKTEELTKNGNFQFKMMVDGKKIYESNLHPGAPYPKIKDTATIITKPLIDNQHEGGWWSQSFWGRFMHFGGDSAMTEGPHRLRLEVRPYINIGSGVKVGELMAAGELDIQVKLKPEIDISNIHLTPLKPYDGFDISQDDFNQSLMKEMMGNVNESVFRHISSVVVIKDGKLLFEEYFNGENRNTLHDPRSVGKSFASTMTGIALNEGYLKSVHQSLKEFYPFKSFANYSSEKEALSIEDLLTMSAVLDGNDDDYDSPGNEENMYPTNDWVKFTLDLPVNLTRPKDEWHYFTAGVVVLGDILHKSVPGGLEAYANQKLFKPLNITDYQWQYTPQHVVNTAGGIQLRALDFAKYGQLYKNKGNWHGEQIIPRSWIDHTFSKHRMIPGREDEYYGYLFWNKKFKIKDKTYETFYCTGNGGNKIYVFKDQPLVIVVTATAYGAPYAHPQVDRMMTEFILPALLK